MKWRRHIEDRFTRGFISGFIANLCLLIWDFFSYYVIRFTDLRLLDFAGQLLNGHPPKALPDLIFAQVSQILFASTMGSVFAYVIRYVEDRNLALKSCLFSLGIWFVTYAVFSLAQVPLQEKVGWQTSFSDFFGAAIYGVVLWRTWRTLERARIQTG